MISSSHQRPVTPLEGPISWLSSQKLSVRSESLSSSPLTLPVSLSLQLPSDLKIKKIDLFSGFPPLSLYQALCRQLEQQRLVEAEAPPTLKEVLRDTLLTDLQLGGERVTVRYLE
jgi:hypothetical protein